MTRTRTDLWQQTGAGKSDPLPGQDLHVGRTVEFDLQHVTGQQLRLQDVQLHVGGSEGDDLVQGVDDGWDDEVGPEERSGSDPLQAVNDAEEVEENIELVNLPEERVGSGPDSGMGEDEDGTHRDPEDDSGQTGQSLEQPVGNVGLLVAAEPELRTEAVEVLQRLGGHVVEVAEMPHL